MNEGHLIFGKVFCEKFNLPEDLFVWAKAPDVAIWLDELSNVVFHRYTLHGLPNVDKAIKVARKKNVFVEVDLERSSPYFLPLEYSEEFRSEVVTLVVSHSFLDTLNGPVPPSYPKSREFKLIPEQIKRYIRVALNDPDSLRDLFEDIIDDYDDQLRLREQMIREYNDLPRLDDATILPRIIAIYREYLDY